MTIARTTALALTGAAALAFVGAGAADAAPASRYLELYVAWKGAECLDVNWPDGTTSHVCDGDQYVDGRRLDHAAAWSAYARPGELVTMDPVMGAADFIECEIQVEGRGLLDYDSAHRGDGHNALCSGRA